MFSRISAAMSDSSTKKKKNVYFDETFIVDFMFSRISAAMSDSSTKKKMFILMRSLL